MTIHPEKPIKIATADDAEVMFKAMQAAALYRDIVQFVPQPSADDVVEGNADVDMGSFEYCVRKFGADPLALAWLLMRGFPGGRVAA